MAVFVAFADETDIGTDHRGQFFYCGFLAPEPDWSNIFTPLWDARVLKGPPRIPYFHMTEMRSRSWREEHGIDRAESEYRIDEAFGVISAIPSLVPAGCEFNGGRVLDVFQKKVKFSTGAVRRFEPDYLGFYGFTIAVLLYVEQMYPTAEKVDFVVERKSSVTDRIKEFHATLAGGFSALGYSDSARLMGELIPGGKDRAPLHAADLLCWYTRRGHERTLDARDVKRYSKIASRKGPHIDLTDAEIDRLYDFLSRDTSEQGQERIPEVRRDDAGADEGSALGHQGEARRGESSKKAEV